MANKQFLGQIELEEKGAKLDLADRKILYLLCLNARYSDTAIAKALRMKRETVGYRIRRLVDEGLLNGYITLIDSRRLGFRMHMLDIKLKRPGSGQDIIKQIINLKNVTRINSLGGDYDLQIIVTSRTLEELDSFLERLLNDHADIIQKYIVLEILDENFTGMNTILSPAERNPIKINEKKGSTFENDFAKAKRTSETVEIDDTDAKLLELLRLNGRMPIAEISRKINLSVPAVENRMRRLIREEVIKAFIPLTPLNVVGFQWYLVFFQVKNMDKKKFLYYIKQSSNIAWYVRIVGKWSYVFSIFVKDNAEFNSIINSIRTDFSENIISYDSVIVFEQHKFVHRIT